ncbi:MAG: PH domain-containing protein [Alphaproteobacteria bacterium]|nr:PH domain-containing protein [Alphaproteobacteria bacterium]
MSYIQKSLGDGETIIARARFHTLYFFAAWLVLLVPLALLLAALAQAQAQPDPYTVAAGILFVLGLFTFLKMMIRQWSTEIGITSHRFVEKYGLLSMRTNEIALPNIEGVKVTQSILGRIFGYGTVKIEGTGVDSVTTPAIADPVGFVRAIQTAKEHIAGLTATTRV